MDSSFLLACRFGVANESTPIVLADVKCSHSSHLHLLRCNHNEPDNGGVKYGCSDHSKDVVVYCGELLSSAAIEK